MFGEDIDKKVKEKLNQIWDECGYDILMCDDEIDPDLPQYEKENLASIMPREDVFCVCTDLMFSRLESPVSLKDWTQKRLHLDSEEWEKFIAFCFPFKQYGL